MRTFATVYFATLAVFAAAGLSDFVDRVPRGLAAAAVLFLLGGFFWLAAEMELVRRR